MALRSRSLHPELILTGASDRRFGIAALAVSAGSAVRGGFTLYPEIYHRPLNYDQNRSLIDNNLQLATLAGAASKHLEPKVFFSAADLETARALAQSVNPGRKPLAIFVTQNSGGQRTGWHTDRFAEVIRYAHNHIGCAVAYVGIDKDREPIEEIRKAADEIGISVAGRTSVTELAALLCLSDVAVSLDTGTMHVGRAMGLPLVILGPSWQAPIEWLPLNRPDATILRGPDIDRKNIPANYMLDEIDAASVCSALDDLLNRYPPSEANRSERVAASISVVDHLQ
jgi:ADP-heptose:LPS heptosyltransferase